MLRSRTLMVRTVAGAVLGLGLTPLLVSPAQAAGVDSQQAYAKASNTGSNDQFGYSVAISGDTMVVGAVSEDSNATGANGDQADNSASFSGAVYVFTRTGTTWSQEAYLKASNTGGGDEFGNSVAIAGDTIVVGAPGEDSNATGVNGNQADNSADASGAVYVFTRTGTTWSQEAYLKASNTDSNDQFGYSVAISGDTIVAGANLEESIATGVNGNQADNSANASGAAYVFTRTGTTWGQQAYLKASDTDSNDQFGRTVAIAGDTIVAGGPGESSNATGVNGDQSDNSAIASGAAYVFTRSGSTWSQQAYLKASNTGSNDQFGRIVAIVGDTIVAGAPGEASNATGINGDQADNSAIASGAAYVFTRTGTAWSQQAYLKASNTDSSDQFGRIVAIAGDTIVAGAPGEASNATGINGNQSDNSANVSGAAYVFTRAGTTWGQQAYLKASNTGSNDQFGYSVAIAGDTVVAGADGEDSNATGVNGDQADNSAIASGAAYVFVASPVAPNPDLDSDGLSNGLEAALGSNPNKTDTDGDGLRDATEYNGFTITKKVINCARVATAIGKVRTSLVRADSDGDGLADRVEVFGVKVRQVVVTGKNSGYVLTLLQSNPLKRDTDGDGVADKVETTGSAAKKFAYAKTNPANCHTDGGLRGDGYELSKGSNPVRAGEA